MAFAKIVAPLDGSPEGEAVLPRVELFTRATGARVSFCGLEVPAGLGRPGAPRELAADRHGHEAGEVTLGGRVVRVRPSTLCGEASRASRLSTLSVLLAYCMRLHRRTAVRGAAPCLSRRRSRVRVPSLPYRFPAPSLFFMGL
jgi:hypothetical protein